MDGRKKTKRRCNISYIFPMDFTAYSVERGRKKYVSITAFLYVYLSNIKFSKKILLQEINILFQRIY